MAGSPDGCQPPDGPMGATAGWAVAGWPDGWVPVGITPSPPDGPMGGHAGWAGGP
jgi:hypothetical protein